jgi:hypothetical protein
MVAALQFGLQFEKTPQNWANYRFDGMLTNADGSSYIIMW